MAFTLENPAEAYAAVSLLIAGADGVGTVEERQFLFEKLATIDVFAGQDAESMGCLLGTLTGRMFAELPNDGVKLNDEAVGQLCQTAKGKLGRGTVRTTVHVGCRVGLLRRTRRRRAGDADPDR